MTKLDIALACIAEPLDSLEELAFQPPARWPTRFYVLGDRGVRELPIEHALISLWVARRSRLRRGLRHLL